MIELGGAATDEASVATSLRAKPEFLETAFDRTYSDASRAWLDRVVVDVSVAGFLAHLLLVFLSRTLAALTTLIAAVDKN